MSPRLNPPLPLIDLHLHLEGSISRATLAALAARHRLTVPPLRGFDGLRGFLKSFGAVCDLLVDEEDFHRAASDLFGRARRIGVVHMEVLFSPQVFQRRGLALAPIMRGLLRARDEAIARGGFSVVYIADGVRQWGGEWFDETVRILGPWAGRGLAGIGVGGDETAVAASEFADAFRRARGLGLRATVHAGESAGPDSIREALDALAPDRVGHGFRAVADPDLMGRLAELDIALEVCPSSNVATGVAASWRSHPLRRLHDAGVPVTINSDDGTFFGTDVRREVRMASRLLRFTRAELTGMMRTAARVSFLSSRERQRLERRIAAAWGRPRGI